MILRIELPRWFWWIVGTRLARFSWSLQGFNGEYLVGQYSRDGNAMVADYSTRVTISSTNPLVTFTNATFAEHKGT